MIDTAVEFSVVARRPSAQPRVAPASSTEAGPHRSRVRVESGRTPHAAQGPRVVVVRRVSVLHDQQPLHRVAGSRARLPRDPPRRRAAVDASPGGGRCRRRRSDPDVAALSRSPRLRRRRVVPAGGDPARRSAPRGLRVPDGRQHRSVRRRSAAGVSDVGDGGRVLRHGPRCSGRDSEVRSVRHRRQRLPADDTDLRRLSDRLTGMYSCHSNDLSVSSLSVTHALPSALWHCWLGVRKSIRPVKIE